MSRVRVSASAVGPTTLSNPEIHTAFFPLGCLVAYAKAHREGSLRDYFDFEPITPLQTHEFEEFLDKAPQEPGVFLLSCFVWNFEANMEFAAAVKRRAPGSLVVVGGPHVPRREKECERLFQAHPQIDVAGRNEGEVTVAEILETIHEQRLSTEGICRADFSSVAGITFRSGDGVVRTPDRPRTKELGLFPSPYVTGEYDHWFENMHYMPIESNRGCPYGCTFCDWGAATLSKLNRISLERVLAEVEFSAKRRTHMLGIADANFGILPRDVEIARHIVRMREIYGYPKFVAYSNAKVATPRLTEIAQLFHDAGLILSAQISTQTIDETTLDNVERANIKVSEYQKLIAFLHRADIPIVSDMMVGLPGQSLETVKTDLQFFFDHKVVGLLFATSLMPNAPMSAEEYRARFSIEVDADGMVVSTYSFDQAEYLRMFNLCLVYKLFVKLGLTRYLLYFAQVDYGVKAIDVVERWLERATMDPVLYPLSYLVKTRLFTGAMSKRRHDWLVLAWTHEDALFLFDAPQAFFREVVDMISREFGVTLEGSDLEAVLLANEAILPRVGRQLPHRVDLPHDVSGYFADLRRLPNLAAVGPDFLRLAQRGAGNVEIGEQAECTSYGFADLELTYGLLERASNMRI